MKSINLAATETTPGIIMDSERDEIKISGRSIIDEVKTFYEPILEWLELYVNQKKEKTTIEFKFDYLSTATSKIMIQMLHKLEELKNIGSDVQVKWYYSNDDQDILETGEIFSELVKLPFECIGYELV